MDTTPADFGAGAGNLATPARAPHAGARWFWAPLVISTALIITTSALQRLGGGFDLGIANGSWLYALQRDAPAIAWLVAPAVVALAAVGVALRTPGIENRWGAVARLLGLLCLQMAVILSAPLLVSAILGPFETTQGLASGQSLGFSVLSAALAGWVWIPLGVTLAVAMGVLTPESAPRAWPRRLRYWLRAGAVAGLAGAFFALLAPVLVDTLMAARLAAIGVWNCQANSGASCYGGQLLSLAEELGLSSLVGPVVGAVIGGFIAPELTRPAAAPIEPVPSGEMAAGRSWGARAWRYLAGVIVGALYLALVVGLIFALSNGRTFNLFGPTMTWYVVLEVLALLIPAGWVALALARGRLAGALDQGARDALRWALVAFASLTAVIVPVVVSASAGPLFASDFVMLSLIAFSFGAAFGLLWPVEVGAHRVGAGWRAGAGAGFMGWLGIAIPAAALVGVSVYSFLTYDATASGCHGLGCGGLEIAAYDSLVSGFVYIIVYGLLAAAAGGGLAGLLRAALVAGGRASAAGDAGAE